MGYLAGFALAVMLGALLFGALMVRRAIREVKALNARVRAAAERISDAAAVIETLTPHDR